MLVEAYKAKDGSLELSHADGVAWYDAPIPPRWHRCFVQTRGWDRYVYCIDRCACGAIRYDGGLWMERNSRAR